MPRRGSRRTTQRPAVSALTVGDSWAVTVTVTVTRTERPACSGHILILGLANAGPPAVFLLPGSGPRWRPGRPPTRGRALRAGAGPPSHPVAAAPGPKPVVTVVTWPVRVTDCPAEAGITVAATCCGKPGP